MHGSKTSRANNPLSKLFRRPRAIPHWHLMAHRPPMLTSTCRKRRKNGSCCTTMSTSALEDGASSERVRSRLNNFEGGWLPAIHYLATTRMLCEEVPPGDNTAAANCRQRATGL